MRIKFISLVKSSATPLNKDLLSTISESISAFGDVEVVDTAPDLVHICGKWSSASATTIKHYTNKGVPVVFTSANGLAEQLTTLSCMLAREVHVYDRHDNYASTIQRTVCKDIQRTRSVCKRGYTAKTQGRFRRNHQGYNCTSVVSTIRLQARDDPSNAARFSFRHAYKQRLRRRRNA